jgi:hypothetical protein
VTHEKAISQSLAGRTVFDSKAKPSSVQASRQLSLF